MNTVDAQRERDEQRERREHRDSEPPITVNDTKADAA
jgi:hypothetical protein